MEEVPRRTSLAPLAFPCFVLCFIGVETAGQIRLPGAGAHHVHCTVEPSPGHIFGVDVSTLKFSAQGAGGRAEESKPRGVSFDLKVDRGVGVMQVGGVRGGGQILSGAEAPTKMSESA